MASVSSRPERKLDESVTPRTAMMTARMDTNSKIHVAAALFQLITDLLDGLPGKLRLFLGDETGKLFAA